MLGYNDIKSILNLQDVCIIDMKNTPDDNTLYPILQNDEKSKQITQIHAPCLPSFMVIFPCYFFIPTIDKEPQKSARLQNLSEAEKRDGRSDQK